MKNNFQSYFALFERAKLGPSDIVLIHNGANCYNTAAVGLALSKGCLIYITCHNRKEKQYILDLFPKIQNENVILNSSKIPFYQYIMSNTSGKGVNLIFNSYSDSLVKDSTICASKNCRFVNINNSIEDLFVSDDLVNRNFSFFNVTISELFETQEQILRNITNQITNLLQLGDLIVPLKSTIHTKNDIKTILRQYEEKNPNEKCVLKIKEKSGLFSRPNNKILALLRTYMDPRKSYIIIGGLGGFGLELTKWLIERGATKIILNSRREVSSGYQAYCLQKFREQNIAVLTDISDTTTLEGAECLLNYALNLGPIGGIFNIPMLLKDEMILDQNADNFTKVVAPKVFSTQNFDFLTRKLSEKLDHFVVFSSVVSSWGNATQTNYGFANSALERLVEARKAEGLPALAVQWGPIGDVGFVARLKVNKVRFLEAVPQAILSCLDVLDLFLVQNEATVVSSTVFTEDEDEQGQKKSLMDAVIGLFGIKNIENLDDSQTLLNLGMDSLLGFEIKHLMAKEYGIEMSVMEIRAVTVEKLREMSNSEF